MKTLTTIKAEKQTKVDELIKAVGMFFAFNQAQLEANKTPLEPGDKYTDCGHGAFMPKSKVQAYIDGSEAIDKWYTLELKTNKARAQNIEYELSNYECYYTGDITNAVNALGDNYTFDEVQAVYNKNRRKHAND